MLIASSFNISSTNSFTSVILTPLGHNGLGGEVEEDGVVVLLLLPSLDAVVDEEVRLLLLLLVLLLDEVILKEGRLILLPLAEFDNHDDIGCSWNPCTTIIKVEEGGMVVDIINININSNNVPVVMKLRRRPLPPPLLPRS